MVDDAKRSPIEDIGDSEKARAARMAADRRLTMSERLAKLHIMCKQFNAIKGIASR